jgi:hypothetical protein
MGDVLFNDRSGRSRRQRPAPEQRLCDCAHGGAVYLHKSLSRDDLASLPEPCVFAQEEFARNLGGLPIVLAGPTAVGAGVEQPLTCESGEAGPHYLPQHFHLQAIIANAVVLNDPTVDGLDVTEGSFLLVGLDRDLIDRMPVENVNDRVTGFVIGNLSTIHAEPPIQ